MRLKLDLHPIFNDSRAIEAALLEILEEAVVRHAAEVEIIPGKGTGALKKAVLRFLDRPEVKARYHRLEKDSENWGKLFVHFRHETPDPAAKLRSVPARATVTAPCACCGDVITVVEPEENPANAVPVECPWCGSPNRLSFWRDGRNRVQARAVLDYTGA